MAGSNLGEGEAVAGSNLGEGEAVAGLLPFVMKQESLHPFHLTRLQIEVENLSEFKDTHRLLYAFTPEDKTKKKDVPNSKNAHTLDNAMRTLTTGYFGIDNKYLLLDEVYDFVNPIHKTSKESNPAKSAVIAIFRCVLGHEVKYHDGSTAIKDHTDECRKELCNNLIKQINNEVSEYSKMVLTADPSPAAQLICYKTLQNTNRMKVVFSELMGGKSYDEVLIERATEAAEASKATRIVKNLQPKPPKPVPLHQRSMTYYTAVKDVQTEAIINSTKKVLLFHIQQAFDGVCLNSWCGQDSERSDIISEVENF